MTGNREVCHSEMCRNHCPALEGGAHGFGAILAQVTQQVLVEKGGSLRSSDLG